MADGTLVYPRWIAKGEKVGNPYASTPEGICNWRDLGGLVGEGGKQIIFGKVFRGSTPYHAKAAGQAKFNSLISGQINLMGSNDPSKGDYCKEEQQKPSWFNGSSICVRMKDGVNQAVYDGITFMIQVLQSGGSVYFHCHEGRNRTATFASHLLTALGVSDEAIKAENSLSLEVFGSCTKSGRASGVITSDQAAKLKQLLLGEPGQMSGGGGMITGGMSGGGGGGPRGVSIAGDDGTQRPYSWEGDSDVFTDSRGKLYSKNNLSSGIHRFTIVTGGGGGEYISSGATGEYGPGKEPIPPGFYSDKALLYMLQNAEGRVGIQWVTSVRGNTICTAEACDGYDLPGGVHSKSIATELGVSGSEFSTWVSITNGWRPCLGKEGYGTGAAGGWYTSKLPDDHPYWGKLVPYYRDRMIKAWHKPLIQAITDPAEKLGCMHGIHWNCGMVSDPARIPAGNKASFIRVARTAITL